jgi:hypothetical protein
MKKLIFIIFACVVIIFSCKKKDTDKPTPNPSTNNYYGSDTSTKHTGCLPATREELQKIGFVEDLDTSKIPIFTKTQVEDKPYYLENLPDAKTQLYEDCSAWATAYGMMSIYYKKIRSADFLGSPAFIYNQYSGGKDSGISIPNALFLLQGIGTCNLTLMSATSKISDPVSDEARENALNQAVSEIKRFRTLDISEIKYYLKNKKIPVIFSAHVDEDFEEPSLHYEAFELSDDKRLIWKYPSSDLPNYHAMVICGYDDKINAFYVLNSWGPYWAQKGFIWIDYSTFLKVADEAYIAFPELASTDDAKLQDNKIIVSAEVFNYGVFNVTSRGFCYGENSAPTISSSKVSNGTYGKYSDELTGLKPNTKYYLRAYASNGITTFYGNQTSFVTPNVQINVPALTTTHVTSITATTASSGGNISSDGGSPITAKGICWSTSPNPTIALPTKTNDGIGTGSFVSNISGLTANTTYYVRAYATNSIGTSYGNELSFTTASSSIQGINYSLISYERHYHDSNGNTYDVSDSGGVGALTLYPNTDSCTLSFKAYAEAASQLLSGKYLGTNITLYNAAYVDGLFHPLTSPITFSTLDQEVSFTMHIAYYYPPNDVTYYDDDPVVLKKQ